ncbi:hypothetical protein V6Z11_A03G174200 [Gossypium hirsutum]
MASESKNPSFSENRSTKEVHFKDHNTNEGIDMVVDDEPKSTLSWKDRLLGNLASGSKELGTQIRFGDDDEIELMDKDITRSMVNAIPTIDFSERVNQFLIKNMATTVVLKLLGQSIGYNALQSQCL